MLKFFHKYLLKTDPELAHNIALKLLPLAPIAQDIPNQAISLCGLNFKNKIGLAAGLDKNGDALSAWEKMGFGFIELGTVTPQPQYGNPKPRMFRISDASGLINRMGFNNKGVDYLIDKIKLYRLNSSQSGAIIGVNIGKNASTAIENAADDYNICLEKAYPHADYIALNISSPNTANLRSLQEGVHLKALLKSLKQSQQELTQKHARYVPLFVKIAPDMDDAACITLANTLLEYALDGVIATNTTLSRESIKGLEHASEQGGLSGKPVFERSTEIIRVLYSVLGENIPIIAVGGIFSGQDAQAKIDAGAKLIQLYTGFVYQGPQLISEISDKFNKI